MAAALSVPKITLYEGSPWFFEVDSMTTPGAQQTLVSQTVPADTIRKLYKLSVVCRAESSYKVFADGDLIGSGRTGAATPCSDFFFTPPRDLAAGVALQVVFQARSGSPIVGVQAFVQASDVEG